MAGVLSLILVGVLLGGAVAKVGDPETLGVFTTPPRPDGDVFFVETFNDKKKFDTWWAPSQAKKEGVDEKIAKYDGEWRLVAPSEGGFEEDRGLVMPTGGKHYAISTMLDRPFEFKTKEAFIVQYEVNFQEGMSCGGAYLKLITQADGFDLEEFHDKTPYTIMFGPDRCGGDAKLHFIFRHKNPKTGEFEEKHAKRTSDLKFFDDQKTHLFTLILRKDNTYSILVDQFSVNDGNLLEDFTPPVNPEKEIDDPDEKKPEDWDDRPKIPEPGAVKPDDWDEDAPAKIADPDAVKPDGWMDDGPEYIPDPDSSKPEDWDDEMDGEWEAPMIPNPVCDEVGCGEWTAPLIANSAYKGKWSAPMIDNPDYKGEWKPRKIPNPNFFEDKHPFVSMSTIFAVGFELWTITGGVYFDNIIITSELTVANNFAYDGWVKKFEKEKAADGSNLPGWLDQFVNYANEFPFLWFLYVVILALPCLVLACCCVRSKPAPSPGEVAALRKKTDEPSPDSPPEGEDEEETDSPRPKEDEDSFIEEVEVQKQGDDKEEDEMQEEKTKEDKEDEKGGNDQPEDLAAKESPKKRGRRKKAGV